MRDKTLKALFVVARKPIYRVATKAGPYGTHFVFIHIRLTGKVIAHRQQVLHRLAAVIVADLIVPRLAEARQAAAVRRHHDIPVSRHHLHIPAEREKLTHRTLRSTLAIEQGRIFLSRI